MNPLILRLVEKVIRTSDQAHPADAVLKQALKSQTGVLRTEAREVSNLVFSYYRWRSWLDESAEMSDQLLRARDLAMDFAHRPESFSDEELIGRCLPEWIRSEIDVTPEFVRALQSEPQLWLRARPGQGSKLAKRLHHCRIFGEGALNDTLAYQGREDLFRTAEFHAGEFELQDLNSQAVGLACSPIPGETWWDACAGEGGKLLHLSDLMQNKGLVWGTDRAEWRLKSLRRRAARAKIFNYRSALWDGGPKLPTRTRFDGVLIDAPCTGTGTWQRNPHARWTLRPDDVRELAEIQIRLLANAAPSVKPGGKLIYSVCSLTRSETIQVAEAFEKMSPDFCPLSLLNPLAPAGGTVERLLMLPQQGGGNGMFVAGWLRKKGSGHASSP